MAKTFERHFASVPVATQRLPRAPVGQLSDTGQGLESQALAQVGKGLTDTASILFKWNGREGNSQYDTARGAVRGLIGEFELTGYANTTEHDKAFKQLEKDIIKLSPVNRSGAKKFSTWSNLQRAKWKSIADEKKIRMIDQQNQAALFNNLINVAKDYKDPAEARARIETLIAGGLDDKSIKTATQALAMRDKATENWTRVDIWRRATKDIRPDGEVDWSQAVKWFSQAENIEGIDSGIIDSLLEDATSQLTNQKTSDNEAREKQQELSRGELNDILQKGQIPTPTQINDAKLPEKEETTYLKWAAAETRRVNKGENIITDQKRRAELNTMALDIWREAVTKQQFDAAVNEARYGKKPTIDDTAYKELTNTAATTLKSSQAEALRRAGNETANLVVDVRDDKSFQAIIAMLTSDDKKKFIEKRQLQFWYLSQYNKEMRDWITKNPDKIGKDFFQHSEQLKHQYWNSSIDDIKARKLEREAELAEPLKPESVIMVSPKGKRFNVPVEKKQLFIDNEFIEE